MKLNPIATSQLFVVVALSAVFVWSLQHRDAGSVGLTARLQPGTCVGWVNATPSDEGGTATWPNWADTDLEVTTGTMSIGVRSSADALGTVNLAIFVDEATAKEWKLTDGERALWRPSSSLRSLVIDSAQRFSVRVLSHDYGAISLSPGMAWASFGLSRTSGTRTSTMYLEVAGVASSEFTIKEDQADRKGVFAERPPFSFMSWPPQYPKGTRAWSGALTPERGESNNNECVERVAPERRLELAAALGPLPTSALKEQARARFTRAVKRVVVSGLTGALMIDAGEGRTIGPDDTVDVAGEIAQLSVDTQAANLAFVGKFSALRVNDDDIRGRLIDAWPWYVQAAFWSLFGWAAVGAWHSRRELLLYARSLRRRKSA
jgi:hypothetical protein